LPISVNLLLILSEFPKKVKIEAPIAHTVFPLMRGGKPIDAGGEGLLNTSN
jgi:hypothetical protein